MRNERDYHYPVISKITGYKDFIIQFSEIYQDYSAWKLAQLHGFNPLADILGEQIANTLTLPAKRLRPLFMYLTFILCGGKPNEATTQLGIALETFHSFALIHDDITDLAITRRGADTIEEFFRKRSRHLQHNDPVHIGLNMAMYAGDILLFQSTFTAITLPVEPNLLRKIQNCFYEMQTEVVMGQIDDGMGIDNDDWEAVTEERILKILSDKSGKYSIQKPMMLGALLAETDSLTLEKIEKLGEDFGIVFQLQDDLLGVFGLESETGKSSESDIREGKKTLLMYHAYQRADEIGKQRILASVGNHNATKLEIDEVKQIIISTGVKQEMELRCQEGVQNFLKGLQLITQDQEVYLQMQLLAEYIINRKS